MILSESLVGREGGAGGRGPGCYWDGEIVLDPPEIKINDVQ